MSLEAWLPLLVLAAALCAISALLVRRYALAVGMVDIPNARSSHHRVVPRGGGVAIAVIVLIGLSLLFLHRLVSLPLYAALTGGGLLVAGVSLVEDYRRLPITLRLLCHIVAVAWALTWLGGMPPLQVGTLVWSSGWPLQLFGGLALVWLINLFNFMDGIDGLAAVEALFLGAVGALLLGLSSEGGLVLSLVAASCSGFLLLNWAPAALFMGDSGSCFLGFVFGVLAIAPAAGASLPAWVWLILLGVFIVDATVTLLTRALTNARTWYQAHRSHAYQRSARYLGSHAKVSLTVSACNLVWLLPWAYLAVEYPRWGAPIAAAALLPLALLARRLGAGRPD